MILKPISVLGLHVRDNMIPIIGVILVVKDVRDVEVNIA